MHLLMDPKSAPSAEAWEVGGAWLLLCKHANKLYKIPLFQMLWVVP